jgi:FlaA1/EpsC-like NDP-sugar epimerase
MENKRVFIPGGAGSIGRELVKQLAPNNHIYIQDIDETRMFSLVEELRLKGYDVMGRVGDIRNKETTLGVFLEFMPHVVFNCAALKNVTPSMQTPREHVKTNVEGVLNLLELAREFGVIRFIQVSTDKASQCENVMGWSKRGAELFCKIYNRTFVRFGNVMGSEGSILQIWERQFENGEPLTITDERMERYTMTIPQACELLIEAASMEGGQGLIMDMGEPKKIIDLKKELYGDYPVKIIGIRQGEVLIEKLMTDEEIGRAVKKGKFWII